ncbi:proteasome assembly chaperone family protein [Fervidicoccus fontis]|uniref:Proteasome assembly chaperone family protein n=1 Tax=Fervidicoccus fontis TaxID=683846 RepID=A0A843AJD8_9CREN|nr:PAC2 family protein [Fervidicoccus fontis]MBE9391689.1 proteasome assembly chaperone family protein [Fervidicoccus fontis]
MNIIREEEIGGILIQEYEEFKLESPSFLIVGFPDAGLVGGISLNHLIRELNPKEIAGIDIPRLNPPIAIIRKGEYHPPIRIFKKDNILFLVSEIPIPANTVQPLSYAILEYCMRRRVDYVIGLTGIGSTERLNKEKPDVFIAYEGDQAKRMILINEGKVFDEGMLMGPFAIFLKEAKRFNLQSLIILAESFPDLPDPEAASVAVEYLSKILSIKISIDKLLEEAEYIRLRTKEIMKQTAKVMGQMGRSAEAQPGILYT